MCGIAGYVSPKIEDGLSVLHRMNQKMIHRGPDDDGVYVNGATGLGMRRLSIIDLEKGHQPIWNETGTVGIVFNGEIYNFRELREELIQKGHRFSTGTDTEVVVHLYEEKGVDSLERLNGMFAFALYDRSENQLFLARDRLGEKPLHYTYQNGNFVFASEIKSILAFPGVESQLDLEALNLYLTYEYVPAPYTIYQNIYKLEPGHYLTFKGGELQIKSYWRPSYQRSRKNLSVDEVVERLRDHIARSVTMRTVSDVPLGAFLSGGIDSSLITAFLTHSSPHKVKTFSIAFEEDSFDESKYARNAAEFLGTEHYEERLTSHQMLDILPDVLEVLDEPFADGSLIPTYLLSKFTRQRVTVALSGDGGDELFGGYPTYQAHRLAHWMPRWVGRPAAQLAGLFPVSDENISLDFKLRRFASGLAYEAPVRNQIWLGSFDPDEKRNLFALEVNEVLKTKDEFGILRDRWNSCDSSHYLNRIWDLDLRFYLQDDILVKVDRASMANSLEVRAPYLDHELVEFVCSLKPDLKLKGLTTKFILKEAAKGILPDSIIHRTKKGFGIPIAKWIKGDLKEMFTDFLSESEIRESGLFNPSYVSNLLKEHLDQRKNHRKLLWTLFVFQAWHSRLRTAVTTGS